MLANLNIICQFHAHSVHQNSAEIYRGRLFFRAGIYRGRLLTLITGSSSRLLRIRFSADLTMYWFPVCHFRCMDLESKYCYFYHSWDFVPYYISTYILLTFMQRPKTEQMILKRIVCFMVGLPVV